MKNQSFKDWLAWGVPCSILVGIFGSYHYLSTGVYPNIDYVIEEIVPHVLKRYDSVRVLNALTGVLLYDSDELQS